MPGGAQAARAQLARKAGWMNLGQQHCGGRGPSALAGRVAQRSCDRDGRSGATPAVEVIAVSTPAMPRPGSHSRRPLLGLRRKPGRLALAVFRMPLRAYRHDAGWLLGRTFLAFVHTGRKTGQPYETAAMVLRYDPDTHEAVICAAWGPDTNWVRNLRTGPAARVRLGRESFAPQHRFLSDEEAFDVAVQFRREHPRRLRLLSAILGWGDLRDDAAVRGFVPTHPFVAFRPAATSPA